jgi:DNA-binding MarR family transcriptional regulator
MARANRDELIEGILKSANNLFRLMLPTVPRELLAMDFSMSQLKALFLLFFKSPMRMSDLASDLGVTLATATGLIDRLVEKEMIIRESDPDDRRVVLCRLSAAGEKGVSRIWETARDRMKDLLRGMDAANLESLNHVLQAMLSAAEGNEKQGIVNLG